jgi:DNA-directed RNA polymerase specialized sigma24 family protein
LRFYEDLPDDEIAAVLGCSASTVRSNAARGLASLRAAVPTPNEEM